jgi:predicted amidophosphoribosyltransferase
MNSRVATPGKTRVCPHCKATILESASVCPGCQHHLRFDPKALAERQAQATFSALRVEGAFKNPEGGESWEYSVVVTIRNDRREEVARKVIGVGALAAGEGRSVTLSVDVFAPGSVK